MLPHLSLVPSATPPHGITWPAPFTMGVKATRAKRLPFPTSQRYASSPVVMATDWTGPELEADSGANGATSREAPLVGCAAGLDRARHGQRRQVEHGDGVVLGAHDEGALPAPGAMSTSMGAVPVAMHMTTTKMTE